MSLVYPISWAFSRLSPTSPGLNWVSIAFDASNRRVPSLNTDTSDLARNNAFSKGSGIRVLLIKPFTPFTIPSLFPSLSLPTASSRISTRFTLMLRYATSDPLQVEEESCVRWPHFEQVTLIRVSRPQLGHLSFDSHRPHSGQVRSTSSKVTTDFFDASITSRRGPPAWPVGNSPWTLGVMILSFAFSGRPMRAPTKMGALFLIGNPASRLNASSEFSPLTSVDGAPRFRIVRRTRASSSRSWISP